jgi:hypothetical protein
MLPLVFIGVCMMSISNVWSQVADTLSVRQKGIIPIAAHTATGNIPKLETALIEGWKFLYMFMHMLVFRGR